jgi:hypothetical protein
MHSTGRPGFHRQPSATIAPELHAASLGSRESRDRPGFQFGNGCHLLQQKFASDARRHFAFVPIPLSGNAIGSWPRRKTSAKRSTSSYLPGRE